MPEHFLHALLIQALGAVYLVTDFSWGGVALVVVMQFVTCGLGIDLGFHRLFSHRSYKVPWPVAYLLAVFGTMALQGGPLEWACIHRQHHRFSDRDGDPHNAGRSLWFAHMGWISHDYFENLTEAKLKRYCPDLWDDRFYRLLYRAPALVPWLSWAALYAWGGGWALRWGVCVRYLVGNNLTWAVNSISHRYGWRAYERRDLSTNCTWLALLTTGGALHNNHHAFPASASHSFAWWQPDLGACLLWAGERVGLVWDMKRPEAWEIQAGYGPANLAELLGVVRPRRRQPVGECPTDPGDAPL